MRHHEKKFKVNILTGLLNFSEFSYDKIFQFHSHRLTHKKNNKRAIMTLDIYQMINLLLGMLLKL
jgi:hypothetical protein